MKAKMRMLLLKDQFHRLLVDIVSFTAANSLDNYGFILFFY